jgi:hypothetical protein
MWLELEEFRGLNREAPGGENESDEEDLPA